MDGFSMPDYFPQLQLPTGLAEEVIRMRSQRSAPWAQLAQSLGSNLKGMGETIGSKRAENLTPDQFSALQSGDPAAIKTAFPRGLTPQAQTMAGMFAKNKAMLSRGFIPNTDTLKQA